MAADVIAIDLPWSARKRRTAIASRSGDAIAVEAVADDDELVGRVAALAGKRARVLVDVPLDGCADLSAAMPTREVDRRFAQAGIAILPSVKSGLRGPELRALAVAVRETRARRRLSQEELGFRSGMHRNYIGAIERAEINPTFRILLKLCRGLAVPLSELILLYQKRRPEPADEPLAPHGQMTGRRNGISPRSVKAAGSRLTAQRTEPSPTGQPPAPRSSSAEPPRPHPAPLAHATTAAVTPHVR